MNKKHIAENVFTLLNQLEKKYETMGQDLPSYLNGLLQADYLTYWDYIHLDILLNLQNPKTAIPDEKIFILYHQITELYFKLILNEMEQIAFIDAICEKIFLKRLKRINQYLNHLINSFDVMIYGMDPEQFLAFRMALLPASGFQSAQYRKIEIFSTDFKNLIHINKKSELSNEDSISILYDSIYWKSGAIELSSSKKTLTLELFEKKYSKEFIELGNKLSKCNIYCKYKNHYKGNEAIIEELKVLDQKANIEWPLQHLKSAIQYLQKDSKIIKATGGTNWKKYLPPAKQQIVFYPKLWTEKELAQWGKINK